MAGHTLLLDGTWDLTVDGGGNIATVSDGYAIAQNVANAVRLFTNDAYLDADRGIPHFDIELGQKPPLAVLRARIVNAAKGVAGVDEAECRFYGFENRVLTGEVAVTLDTGEIVNVEL